MQNAYRKVEEKKGKSGGGVCTDKDNDSGWEARRERALQRQMRLLPARSLRPRQIRAEAQCRSRHSLRRPRPLLDIRGEAGEREGRGGGFEQLMYRMPCLIFMRIDRNLVRLKSYKKRHDKLFVNAMMSAMTQSFRDSSAFM